MYRNDFTPAWENQVGVSRQAPVVQPVSESHPVNEGPDQQFRLRVLRPNPAHPLASLGGGQGVHLALS
jgi:hypothetical protein